MLQDIRRSGCDVVSLTINEIDDEIEDDIIPASISFSACRKASPESWIDFDEVESVPNEAELAEKSLTAVHMSSNLL